MASLHLRPCAPCLLAASLALHACGAGSPGATSHTEPTTLPLRAFLPRPRPALGLAPLKERAPDALRVPAPALPLPATPPCAAPPPPAAERLTTGSAESTSYDLDDALLRDSFEREKEAALAGAPVIACHVYVASAPSADAPQAHVAIAPGELTAFSIGGLDFALWLAADPFEGSQLVLSARRAGDALDLYGRTLWLSALPPDRSCDGPGFTGLVPGGRVPSKYVFFCTAQVPAAEKHAKMRTGKPTTVACPSAFVTPTRLELVLPA